MCEGSIHVKHRQATDKEQLVIRALPNYGSLKGTYPLKGTNAEKGLLVCIRRKTDAIIKQVRLEGGVVPAIQKQYEGKRNVKVELISRFAQVRFDNGYSMSMSGLKEGVRIDIGIPVAKKLTGKPGMKVVDKALKEVLALPPEPKPEGEQQPADETQPEPAPAPAEQDPAPEPTTARRRAPARRR